MEPLLVLPPVLLVGALLVWSWRSSRSARDPSATVNHFNRALLAMQPEEGTADAAHGDAPASTRGSTDDETSEPLPQGS